MPPIPEDDNKDSLGDDLDIVENMDFPDVIMPMGTFDSDDQEEDMASLGGYQLLPQDPDDMPMPTVDDEATESDLPVSETSNQSCRTNGSLHCEQPHPSHYPDGCSPAYYQVPDFPKPNKKDLLWNEATKTEDRIKIDKDQASEIKATMAGFQLPFSHVPEWAKNVSDEQWKDIVISRISNE